MSVTEDFFANFQIILIIILIFNDYSMAQSSLSMPTAIELFPCRGEAMPGKPTTMNQYEKQIKDQLKVSRRFCMQERNRNQKELNVLTNL